MESAWSTLRSCCQGRRKVSKSDHAENQKQTANLIDVNSRDSEDSAIQNTNGLRGNGRQITALLDNAVVVGSSVSSDTDMNSSSINNVNRSAGTTKNRTTVIFSNLIACFPKRTKSDKNNARKYIESDKEFFFQAQNKNHHKIMVNPPLCTGVTDVGGPDTGGFSSSHHVDIQVFPPKHESAATESEKKNTDIPAKGVIVQSLGTSALHVTSGREDCCKADDTACNLSQDKGCGDISDKESYYSCGSTGSVISLCNHVEIEPGHQVISRCLHKHAGEMNASTEEKADVSDDTIVEGKVFSANRRKSKQDEDCLQDDVFVPDPKDRNGNNFAPLNWRNAKQPSFGELERDFGAFVQKTKLKKRNKTQLAK